MSEWLDDDLDQGSPDELDEAKTDEKRKRRKDARRAIFGGLAAVAVLAAPIVIANALVGGGDGAAAETEIASAAIRSLRSSGELDHADLARARAARSVWVTTTTSTTAPPTTTTAPPPPPTTEPPPPPTTAAPPPPQEVTPPADSGGATPDPYSYATWDQLAQCESGGNWSINTGNGYYGGLQFSLSSWQGVGGTGYPNEASRETQIAMGIRLWESSGWGAWPACTSSLGWR